MEHRYLGKNKLEVSALGLGCMGLSHAYGQPLSYGEDKKLLEKAIDLGYTFFDTAEVYGTPENPHENEEILGKALKPYRSKIKIATKFGICFDTAKEPPYPLLTDSRPQSIIKSLEGSLKRLNTDHIDLYYLHRIDASTPIETVAETVEGLIKEGKVLNWGISEADENTIRKAHAVCPLCAVQNRYSMMARHYESLFACLDELTIGFVAFSPLANGFLSAKYNKDSHFDPKFDYRASMPQFKTENYEKNIDLIQLLNDTAVKHNTTPAVISLAWMMCKKPWIVPIPGTRNLQRLEENAQAAQIKLSAQELQEIDLALNSISMSDVFGGSAFKSKNNK